MNILKDENMVSATILARYQRQESIIVIAYDPTTGGSHISVTYNPDLTQMEFPDLIHLLECAEVDYKLLSGNQPEDRGDQIWIWQEKLRQTELLIEEIKDEMWKRICATRNQNCSSDWMDYVDCCPGMGLQKPEEFIFYWYIYGEFPYDMERYDMEKVHRKLQDLLDELEDADIRDEYWIYQCQTRREQLAQIQKMIDRCAPEDDGVRMDYVEEDVGEPIIFTEQLFPPDVSEFNLQELVEAIEQMQCHLASLEGEQNALHRSTCAAQLQEMLDELNRRILNKLGIEKMQDKEETVPEAYRDLYMTSWAVGRALETVEDIIACWYLSDGFPIGLTPDQLEQLWQKLTEQMNNLERLEEVYEVADTLDLWRFRRDIKAEQLEEIQTLMLQYELNGEEWYPEE